jgi:hypothetical protein
LGQGEIQDEPSNGESVFVYIGVLHIFGHDATGTGASQFLFLFTQRPEFFHFNHFDDKSKEDEQEKGCG